TGAYVKTFIAPNYLVFNGGLNTPTDMIFHGSNLFVSSAGSNNVLEYDAATGAFVANFTSAKPIADPEGLAFDSLNRLYVADGINNNILRFASAGAAPTTFVATPTTFGQGSLKSPRGLAFDAQGNLLVASFDNNEVERYDSS